jgi:2-amino-4-hydroxy-6-hydroxymethyldihydropteridine diphosphokinase
MIVAYISLGSNLGDRLGYINRALGKLKEREDIKIIKVSSFYETEPVGYKEQGKFINAVLALETNLQPYELLQVLQSIETDLDRVRTRRWGPRTIDLDILFYGDQILNDPDLTIPHPRVTERAFVLFPLAEIAPSLLHPITGKSISSHLNALNDRGGVVIFPHNH